MKKTHYIGPTKADVSDQSRTAKVELRLEDSEAREDHLALGIYGYSTGTEYFLLHLNAQQVAELSAAIHEWRTGRED